MKKILPFVLLFPTLIPAQAYREAIAEKTCQCLTERLSKDSKNKITDVQMGLCLLVAAKPFQKEIKQDLGIDIVRDVSNEAKMSRLGIEIGYSLAAKCPDAMGKVFSEEEEYASSQGSTTQFFSGVVDKVETDSYTVFSLKGDNGILTKFYLISEVESNIDVPAEYRKLVGKKVNISYFQNQIFDYKVNDYRFVNILETLKTEE